MPLSVFAELVPQQKGGDIQRKMATCDDADVEEGLLPAQMFDELQGLIDAAKITDNARVEFGRVRYRRDTDLLGAIICAFYVFDGFDIDAARIQCGKPS